MKRFLLIFALVFSSCSQVQYGDKNDAGYSYYFNSVTGDNANLGTKEKPFKSLDHLNNIKLSNGDKILLSNGSTFLNTIDLINEDGIEICNYKTDENNKLPTINSKGKIASIFIENSSNIKINNVEITANGGGANEFLHKKLKTDLRAGILYLVTDNKVHDSLTISSVIIRDVFYENPGYIRNKGEVRTPNGTKSYGWGIRVLNLSESGNLENISIKNSRFTNISHTAIRFIGNRERQFKNLEIYGNDVFRTGGPGMVFNSTRNLFARANDINYSGSFDDTRKWGRGSGLWTWGSSYAVISQNKFQNANGPADSAGCHIDFNCNDIIVENNLSRNNAGGFIEILGNNYNCSYRNNVSINDGHRVKGKNGAFQEGKTFWLSGYIGRGRERKGPFNSYIYGNTVYVGKDITPKIAVDKASKGVYVTNNVFYFENDPVMVLGDQYRPDPGGGSEIKNVVFENNIFKKNHWPKDVLIQPSNYKLFNQIRLKNTRNYKSALAMKGKGSFAYYIDTNKWFEDIKLDLKDYRPSDVDWRLRSHVYRNRPRQVMSNRTSPARQIFSSFDYSLTRVNFINGDSKGLWQGF
tara:strand:+ start:99 stop:1841 length:1743 start_codon:yes stop_codon:yes gene_type:complete